MHFVDILHVRKTWGIEIWSSFSSSGYNPSNQSCNNPSNQSCTSTYCHQKEKRYP